MNNDTGPAGPDQRNMLYLCILGSLGFLGILLNLLLLFAIWRTKTSEFRNGTSYIIGNLALADSLTGLAVIIYIIGHEDLTTFQLSLVWTTIQASLLSLMVLSIERTIAFAYPFKSGTIVTIRRTILVLICIWLISVSCGVFVRYYKVPSQFALTVVFESSVVVFTISHGVIFVKMQRRNKQMHVFTRNISRDTRKAMHQSANNHVTKVVLILIFVLVVTVLPYMIALQLIFWNRLQLKPPLNDQVLAGVIKFAYYFYPIELLNFIVNPVIYAWRLKRYRRAFYEALAPFNCCCYKLAQTKTFSNGSVNYSRDQSAADLYVRYGKAAQAILLSRSMNNEQKCSEAGYDSDGI